MPEPLDRLKQFLGDHGFAGDRQGEEAIVIRLPTMAYRNRQGEAAVEVRIVADHADDTLRVEVPRAFDPRTHHREATLDCVLRAAARTPRMRVGLDAEGTVRLCIDCSLETGAALEGDVLGALDLLPRFLDAWYPQITSAAESGSCDPDSVPRLAMSGEVRQARHARRNDGLCSAAHGAEGGPAPGPPASAESSAIGDFIRAASMTQRPGAQRNRLRVLFEFRKWMEERGSEPEERT